MERPCNELLGTGRLIAPLAASLRTIFHLIPAVGPFFAPGEGALADGTNFGGQIRLATLTGHFD